MKSVIKIEAIGDNVYQEMLHYRNVANAAFPGLGDRTFGVPKRGYWVARITGFDSKYKYKREFLRPRKDYRKANSKGSRGVYLWYIVESGNIYEVSEKQSWKRNDRYFCTVTDDGEIKKISNDEVDEWIKNILE